jgi:hypothetical protein
VVASMPSLPTSTRSCVARWPSSRTAGPRRRECARPASAVSAHRAR